MSFFDEFFAPRNKSPPSHTPKTHIEEATEVTASNRRWSLQRTFGSIRKSKSSNSKTQDAPVPAASKAAEVNVKPASQSPTGPQAKESALALHSLIVGPPHPGDSSAAPRVRISPAQLASVKAQLHNPETAIPIITQLRALPAQANSTSHTSLPIRAVALPFPDEEVADRHFSQKREVVHPNEGTSDVKFHLPHATIESIIETIKNLHIVSLFTAPDSGTGQPGDVPVPFADAVTTPEKVVNGVIRITPQLMALGFSTGKSIVPDHRGVHPPIDRMSVVTYWWGLELFLPPPTLAYLGRADSISNTFMHFLSQISIPVEGVREILPFVRLFSFGIEYEWDAIKAQDHGKGVICASTWIMPVALIPRPWDFPDPPPKGVDSATPSAPPDAKAPATAVVSTPTASGEKTVATSPSSPPVVA